MKKMLLAIVLLLLLCQSIAWAHWMPREEMYVGGVGAGCTLEYVTSIYGEPQEKRWFNTAGVRGVTYIYSDAFSITGRTGKDDLRQEEELLVVGFSLKDNSLATPNGLTVGMPYETVSAMFGSVDKHTIGGRTFYSYGAPNSAVELTFYVNDKGIITEIYEGTEF